MLIKLRKNIKAPKQYKVKSKNRLLSIKIRFKCYVVNFSRILLLHQHDNSGKYGMALHHGGVSLSDPLIGGLM